MRVRNALLAGAMVSVGSLLASAVEAAMPYSNGAYFNETFTVYPDDPNSAAIGPGSTVAGGVVQLTTTVGTEGIFRAQNLNIAAGSEYVLEYDLRLNAPSGDNFYLLYSQANTPPYLQDIQMRVYNDVSTPSTWEFQVDDASFPGWHQYGGYNYNQWYHLTVHHDTGSNVNVYFDGSLVGTFTDVDPSLPVNLMQMGDPSTGSGYGNATLDNVRIGTAVYYQPTWGVNQSGDWNTFANWKTSYGIPNAVDATATFSSAISSAQTIYTNTPVTAGALTFDNASSYLLTGNGSLTLSASSGSASVQVLQGSHNINLPLIIASDTTLNVASGTTLKLSDPVTVNAGKSLTKSGSGTVTYQSTVTLQSGASVSFASSQHLAGLTVGSNATATLTSGGGKVLQSDALSISTSNGKVDLKDNKMIFRGQGTGSWNGTNYTGATGLIRSGRNGGSWNGSGLVTSMPQAASGLTTLAIASVDDLGLDGATWAGETVYNGDALVKYTYAGDANLSGNITGDDYFRIDSGYVGNLKGYSNGDFDYSGKINADDYFLIDSNYGRQTLGILAGLPASVTAVPEPSLAAAAVGMLAARLLARRHRRN